MGIVNAAYGGIRNFKKIDQGRTDKEIPKKRPEGDQGKGWADIGGLGDSGHREQQVQKA